MVKPSPEAPYFVDRQDEAREAEYGAFPILRGVPGDEGTDMSELVEIRHLHPSAHTKARTWVRASEREQYKTAFSKWNMVPNLGKFKSPLIG